MSNPITPTAQWKKQHLISLQFSDADGSQFILPSQVTLLSAEGLKIPLTKYSDIWIDIGTYAAAEISWSGLDVKLDKTSLVVDNPQTFHVKTKIYDARIRVGDPLNLPLAGATITATLANGTTITTQTNDEGVAILKMIPLGRYNATLTYLGQTLKISGDISLEPVIKSTITFSPSIISIIALVIVLSAVLFLSLKAKRKGEALQSKPSRQTTSSPFT